MSAPPNRLVIPPAVVLVRPRLGFWKSLAEAFKDIWCLKPRRECIRQAMRKLSGNLISVMITWLDRRAVRSGTAPGEFSHAGLTVDGRVRDAQKTEPAINEYELSELRRKRSLVPYDHEEGVSAVANAFTSRDRLPRTQIEEPFAMEGLVRLGIILLTTQSFIGGSWLGRALIARASRKDPDGLFCTEFVARCFIDAGVTLKVAVNPRRMEPFRKTPKRIWRQLVAHRLEAAGASLTDEAIDAEIGRIESFLDQFPPRSDSTSEVDVVQVGDQPGQMPYYLVTPNDLATSPSLVRRPEPV